MDKMIIKKNDEINILKEYIECFTEDFLKQKEDISKRNLYNFLEKQQCFMGSKLSIFKEKVHKIKGENTGIFFKRIFMEKPLLILNSLLADTVEANFEYLSNLSKGYDSGNEIVLIQKTKIQNLKYLTDINRITIKFFIDNTEINSLYGITSIDYINQFSSEVLFRIDVNGKENLDINIDEVYAKINIEYQGIEFKNNLYSWMENIIEAAIYKENGNDIMSIFKSFVAFDNFIQTAYDKISKVYILDKSNFQNYLEQRLEYIEDELWEDYDDFLSDKYIEKLAGQLKDIFRDQSFEIVTYYFEKVQNVTIENANQSRRLIDEKFKKIRDVLEVDLNSSEYGVLSGLIPDLKKIEKYRNNVAHGNELIDLKINNEIYVILTIILSLVFSNDFHSNNWKYLIENDIKRHKKK